MHVATTRRRYRTQLPRPKSHSVMGRAQGRPSRRVCILHVDGAAAFEDLQIDQSCSGPDCRHFHLDRTEVERLVAGGEMRWLSGANAAAFKGIPRMPSMQFQQAYAMWRIAFEDKHQECQGGLVNPR